MTAARTRPPAGASDSTTGESSALMPRSWAKARHGSASRIAAVVAAAARRATPLIESPDGFERDERLRGRIGLHLDVVPFDRRQVLIHEVPLPPLGRIRRLHPVARRNGTGEFDLIDRRV